MSFFNKFKKVIIMYIAYRLTPFFILFKKLISFNSVYMCCRCLIVELSIIFFIENNKCLIIITFQDMNNEMFRMLIFYDYNII